MSARTAADLWRVATVAGLVAAMIAFVWTKVQTEETARGIAAAKRASEALREERSKLQAAVDLALRPGVVRARAARDLHMTDPDPMPQELSVHGAG